MEAELDGARARGRVCPAPGARSAGLSGEGVGAARRRVASLGAAGCERRAAANDEERRRMTTMPRRSGVRTPHLA